jgi:uncharacterized protein (DUF433 family)
MNWRDYIVSDNQILLGKPCIKGTRISVEFILERLASGWSESELLNNYPHITSQQLQAVFAYISENMHDNLLFDLTLPGNDKLIG